MRFRLHVLVWLTLATALSAGPGALQAGSGSLAPRLSPTAILAAPEEPAQETGESSELIFKTINFLILAGALAYLLRKPLADFLTQRSAEIRAGLDEGRKALEASQARLSAVEEKLRRLGDEIAAFKASAAREVEAERERLKQAVEAEAKKIMESARARMETAGRAAKLDVKHFAADQALQQAEQIIRTRLDDAAQKRLVKRFVEEIGTRN